MTAAAVTVLAGGVGEIGGHVLAALFWAAVTVGACALLYVPVRLYLRRRNRKDIDDAIAMVRRPPPPSDSVGDVIGLWDRDWKKKEGGRG